MNDEFTKASADLRWWGHFLKPFNWSVNGWSYRNSASVRSLDDPSKYWFSIDIGMRDVLFALRKKMTGEDFNENTQIEENPPYIISRYECTAVKEYNENYGDDRKCICGHTYIRHFDPYEDMEAVGCKYCHCRNFIERQPDDESPEWTYGS